MDKDQDQASNIMDKEFTSNDLMKFLQNFKTSMETNNEKMQSDLEKKLEKTNEKIDTRLNDIDKDIKELKIKATNDEKMNKRMEDRLRALETEMNKSTELRRKTEKLKNTLTEQDMDPVKYVERSGSGRRITEEMSLKHGTGDKEKSIPVKDVESKRETQNEMNTHDKNKHKDTEEIEGDLRRSFRSDWARAMQEDLESAAMETRGDRGKQKEIQWQNPHKPKENSRDFQPRGRPESRMGWEEDDRQVQQETPDRWEELIPRKQTTKVRKPPSFKNWFGIESESSDSSEDTEVYEWNEVERGRKNEKKKLQQKKKRKETVRMTALKASHMIGIGPVNRKLLEARRKEGETYERAKEMAVKDLLSEQLEYEYDELIELSLEETRFATNGDNMIYMAMSNIEHVKEIHVRKAELRNDIIQVRNYIPPNFYSRYTFLNKICKDKRTEDTDIKTQLRFGPRDIEIFVKYKSEGVPFKLVKIEDFTDATRVPAFDHSIKWKCFTDKPPRRKLGDAGRRTDIRGGPGQPTGQTEIERPAKGNLVRQHSNSSEKVLHKKHKMDSRSSSSSSSDEDNEMEQSDSGKEEDGSPSGRKDLETEDEDEL